MSTETPEPVIHRLFDALNAHDVDAAVALLGPSYRGIDATRSVVTASRNEAEREIRAGLRAFPDLRFSILQCVADPPHASVFWSMAAVHEGSFLGVPPTSQSVAVSGTGLFTVRDGRIVRGVHLWDLAGFLRAIRLLPDLPR